MSAAHKLMKGGPRCEISVVIPTYGNALGLPHLHARLLSALEQFGRSFEIVYIDDCSPDSTWPVLVEMRGEDRRVRLYRLLRNSGQQRAVLCGLEQAGGRYVVTMDDDLQHRPEEIHSLVSELERSGVDAVVGKYTDRQHGLARRLGSWLVKRIAKVALGIPPRLYLTSFRAIRLEVAKEMTDLYNPSPVVGFLLFQVTRNITNVEVRHDERMNGSSTYSLRHLLRYFSEMIIDYSDLPLRFAGYVGFSVALGSFLLGFYYAFRHFAQTIAVPGWATLVLLLTFFSGLVLMTLGVIGIYLVRILRSVNAPRTYSIRECFDD